MSFLFVVAVVAAVAAIAAVAAVTVLAALTKLFNRQARFAVSLFLTAILPLSQITGKKQLDYTNRTYFW